MAKSYGSKKEMEKEGGNFKPLKSGSYIVKLSKLEVKEKKNYDGDVVPTLCMQFAPYEANARNGKMTDVDGGTVKPLTRKLFLDINKVTMGFRENFTIPSKYRALVAALQDVDPMAEVDGPDELTPESAADQLQEFFGEYLVVNVTAYEKNGKYKNKITDFLPVPEDFEADPKIEAIADDAEKKRADKPSKNRTEDDEDDEDEELEEGTADDVTDEEEAPKAKKKKNTKKPLF
jgi:hypothetical protein